MKEPRKCCRGVAIPASKNASHGNQNATLGSPFSETDIEQMSKQAGIHSHLCHNSRTLIKIIRGEERAHYNLLKISFALKPIAFLCVVGRILNNSARRT